MRGAMWCVVGVLVLVVGASFAQWDRGAYIPGDQRVKGTLRVDLIAADDSTDVEFTDTATFSTVVIVVDSTQTLAVDSMYVYGDPQITIAGDVVVDSTLMVGGTITVGDTSTGDYDAWVYASDDGDAMAHKFGWDDGEDAWYTTDNVKYPAIEYADIDTVRVLQEFRYDKCVADTLAANATADTVVMSGVDTSWKPFVSWNESSADSLDCLTAVANEDTVFVTVQNARGVARAYVLIVIR